MACTADNCGIEGCCCEGLTCASNGVSIWISFLPCFLSIGLIKLADLHPAVKSSISNRLRRDRSTLDMMIPFLGLADIHIVGRIFRFLLYFSKG